MKRSDIFNKINNNAFYNHLNFVSPRDAYPAISLEEIWIEDNRVSTGVQIVELNSSDNPVSSPEDDKEKRNRNSWIYGNQEGFQENKNYYKANQSARERRRIRNQYGDHIPSHKQSEYEGFVCPGLYGPPENVIFDHQMNCFTILDKHFVMESESSSENDYADIEEFSCGDTVFGRSSNHDNSNFSNNLGEIVNSENEPDMQKRTVWIYSFKNRHRLNETDLELINIPSCDTSNSSFEEPEEVPNHSKSGHNHRLATPIPPAHVPKLNLTISPKLPTVSEVSEPQKISSANQTDKIFDEVLKPKPFNNWFRSEHATPQRAQYNPNKNTCVVNWMALSPRNRKRKVTPSPVKKQALPTLREVSSIAEKKSQKLEHCDESNKSLSPVQVETQAEVHLESTTSHKATETDMFETSDEPTYMQVGDPDERSNKERIRKLQIRFSPKPILNVSEITEPIEKLDGHNWIVEDNKFSHVPYYYRYEVKVDDPEEHDRVNTAGNTLLIRNMSLLKPAHWAEYLPITGSIPSLHLSLNTNSDSVMDRERQSWFKRIIKWFRCCK